MLVKRSALVSILLGIERLFVWRRTVVVAENPSESAKRALLVRASHADVLIRPLRRLDTPYQSAREYGFPIMMWLNWPGDWEGSDTDKARDLAWGS